mmetsp:Transcript_118155/g.220931  ORF Transcript_118155/g.220931 Transcript_118155/m.220931 type:complete len:886 (-) Transcript_118155:140-2797(-)
MGCCLQPAGKAAIFKEGRKADFRDVYETGEKLGEGTFGMVFECRKKTEKDNKAYAVKMLEHKSSWWGQMSKSQNVQWEVFAQEFEMMRKMEHPNVIRLYDVFADDNFLYFVMEKYENSLIAAVLPCLQKGRKEMPNACIGEVTAQMLASIVYLHDMKIVHRDVKADNYLVDGSTFKGRDFKVVLTDLSTARYLEDGVFLKDMLGTMQYWAPEVVARYYTHKVDCWAIGVILWCMLTMKFPFNTVQETYTKKLTMRADKMSPEQFDLVSQLLEKNPSKRATARQAAEHPWVISSTEKHKRMVDKAKAARGSKSDEKANGVRRDSLSSVDDESPARPDPDSPKDDKRLAGAWDLDPDDCLGFGQIKKVVPKEVEQRRKDALEDANKKFERGERVNMSIDDKMAGKAEDGADVVAKGKQRQGEAKSYSWWSEERCIEKKVPDVHTKCDISTGRVDLEDPAREQAGDIALTEPSNVEELRELLVSLEVDVVRFGEGKAKSLGQLLHELETHECRMLLRQKKAIRVIDLMVLRLKSPSGKYLIEVNQKMADGREREVKRLPAVMRKAGGSGIDMARSEVARLLDQELSTTPRVVQVSMNVMDSMQDVVSSVETSASYPGLESVYRKSFFNAVINKAVPQADLKKLGLMDETPFTSVQACGDATTFEWWPASKCVEEKIQISPKKVVLPEMDGFQPLADGAWTEEKLTAALRQHYIDTNQFGQGTARSIKEFVTETNSGETRLYSKGKELRRYLDILIVKIRNSYGGYLIETGHSFGTGQKRQRNAYPATKVRPFEDKVWAVRRLLGEVDIPYASSKITFGPMRVEKQESPSYPGVLTVYFKQIVEVELQEIDVRNMDDQGLQGAQKWFHHHAGTGAPYRSDTMTSAFTGR